MFTRFFITILSDLTEIFIAQFRTIPRSLRRWCYSLRSGTLWVKFLPSRNVRAMVLRACPPWEKLVQLLIYPRRKLDVIDFYSFRLLLVDYGDFERDPGPVRANYQVSILDAGGQPAKKHKVSPGGMTHYTPSAELRNASFRDSFARDFGNCSETQLGGCDNLNGQTKFQAHTSFSNLEAQFLLPCSIPNMIENETKDFGHLRF
ncbi:hypothetical protein Ocin01_16519 [Orchesella cincta]|uniref:Uncharacterized protein n=1 Tax=Orchesella cincta TaxID=48709 RepID=A0A1D2MB15_ORCCI|nr:hypothetical protein Ocin01_16519 [Orchesella cincta]